MALRSISNLLAFYGTLTPAESATVGGLDEIVIGLFDQFRAPLLRYLWSFGLSIPDGEETLQEVFLELYRHLKLGRPDRNLRGWLFRVAHNLALKRRLHARRESAWRTEMADAESAADSGPTPEDQLLANQYQARALAVVGSLPEQDRRCLYLRAEGLRYREIASILEMSLGSVSLSLARSLGRIARATGR